MQSSHSQSSCGVKSRPRIDTNQCLYHTEDLSTLTHENNRLKKSLREAQAKRAQITKECAEMAKKVTQLQRTNAEYAAFLEDGNAKEASQKQRTDQLKFLNKQLTSEIEQLRVENEDMNGKIRYCHETLEKRYEQLEERSLKRIEQAMKRVKKGVHYLQSLSGLQIEKTREILVDNLRKACDLLRGKISEDDYEGEIQELMNPLKRLQEQVTLKNRQIAQLKQQNARLLEEVAKHRKIEKEHLPMYKEAIQKLKKNLGQVRTQLSDNQYEKLHLKKKYEDKLKEWEQKHNELQREYRKADLQRKICENKLSELEAEVDEEKDRLLGQNQMLKKLYRPSEASQASQLKENVSRDSFLPKKSKNVGGDSFLPKKRENVGGDSFLPKKRENVGGDGFLPKKRENMQKSSAFIKRKEERNNSGEGESGGQDGSVEYHDEYEEYEEANSLVSQESLKNEICKIDQEIMEIHRNLNKQLQIYK